VLRVMETEKFAMFPGCCLDRYVRCVGLGAANAEKEAGGFLSPW
jgi:hypothetical protein